LQIAFELPSISHRLDNFPRPLSICLSYQQSTQIYIRRIIYAWITACSHLHQDCWQQLNSAHESERKVRYSRTNRMRLQTEIKTRRQFYGLVVIREPLRSHG
jgi:hypothetical protein